MNSFGHIEHIYHSINSSAMKGITKKKKLLICDKVDSLMLDELNKREFDVNYEPEITSMKLKDSIEKYDIVILRSRTKLTQDILEKAVNLKIIARAGIGVDNIDTKYAKSRNIQVITAAGSSTHSVAELNVALAVSLARNLIPLDINSKNGIWIKDTGFELSGKTSGIIGFGRIGLSTAKILKSIGMEILAYDIFENQEAIKEVGGHFVSMNELLSNSDFIFILVTLSDSSSNIIGEEQMKMVKSGSFLINTSRSEVIDGRVLLNYLEIGRIKGYATDVLWNEPPTEEWEKTLISKPNVIVTPHIGAQTVEAQKRVAEYTLNNLFAKISEMGI